MNVPFVDLKGQYAALQAEIDEAIADTIGAAQYVGGPLVRSFESQFATYLGCKHCIACGNGTDALEIALQALGAGPGDEVIVPANSWVSTAEAVSFVGATPVFAEVIGSEFNLDPNLLAAAITPRTKGIIAVHLTGRPARMRAILEVAGSHGLWVVEDCAQAHGAAIDGRKVGTFGLVNTFSFYPSKNLGAYGDGGGIVTDDDALAEKMRRISNHGQLVRHDHQFPGRNSHLDSLQAAILSVKLPYLDGWNAKRREIAGWYDQFLDERIIKPEWSAEVTQVFHLYMIRVPQRDELVATLSEAGIGTGVHYPRAIPFTGAYSHLGYTPEQLPVAYRLSQEVLSLPMYPELTMEQVRYVARVVNQNMVFGFANTQYKE